MVKVNLLYNQTDDNLNGYLNIDLTKSGLDEFVDDGEAVEILALQILEYFSYNNIEKEINNWIKKLAYGGTLTLGFKDLNELCKNYLYGLLPFEELRIALYGGQDKEFSMKKSCYSMEYLEKLLVKQGFLIERKEVARFQQPIVLGSLMSYLTVRRPQSD